MHPSFRCTLALAVFSFALPLANIAHADDATPNYKLTDTLHLPGATKWDILTFDVKDQSLFITRGESVDVLDIATQKIIGTIPNTHGVHAVALAPEFGKGFATDGAANTVTMFDMATLKVLATIPVGTKPDVAVYDDATKHVFVADGDSDDFTVLNAKDGTVVGTVKLNGAPEFAVFDGKGHLYVNLEDKSQTQVIDTATLKVTATYDLAPSCDGPTGLAIDTNQSRLFATCGNKVMVVMNAETGKIIDTLPIGDHSDGAVFDAGTNLAFSSNGDGTLTVVGAADDDHYKVLQNVPTRLTARTMALDPATHKLYLAAAETDGFDPPTEKHPHPRPHVKPDTFMILTVSPAAQ